MNNRDVTEAQELHKHCCTNLLFTVTLSLSGLSGAENIACILPLWLATVHKSSSLHIVQSI
jgi:hypothetical protein